MSSCKREQLVPERMLELMEAEGIKTLFGIPDPCFVAMFSIAQRRGWRVIAPHHEQAGAFMADGLYRMTGRPGVIIGNEGPGVANLAPAAICAAKENIPTIFIAGQRERFFDQQVRRGHFQYTHQPKFFEEAMKYVGVIEYAEQVDEIFHEAFRRALTGTPGPVLIEFPQDHAAATHSYGPVLRPSRYRLTRQRADAESIETACALLESAEQPLLLVGSGVFASRAHANAAALARAVGCPVIHTPGAAGVLPGLSDRSVAYSTPAANDAIARADLVVAIGTEIGEPVHYGVGRHWAMGKTDRRWIYIERDATAIGVNRPIDVPLVGDLRDVLPQLTEALAASPRGPGLPPSFVAEVEAMAATRTDFLDSLPRTSPVHPAFFASEAAKVLPEDVVLVRDGGAASIWAMHYAQRQATDVLWSANFGHLGTGLPHAIGAQLAVGDSRRVVLLTGDSAFLFHISELETAVRKKLPIVAIVNCDYSWGLEVKVYDMAFGVDQQKRAVQSATWPLYRFDPSRLEAGEPPLTIDAPGGKIPVSEYMKNETRFRMVEKIDPERFRRFARQAQLTAERRMAVYEHLAKLSLPVADQKSNGGS